MCADSYWDPIAGQGCHAGDHPSGVTQAAQTGQPGARSRSIQTPQPGTGFENRADFASSGAVGIESRIRTAGRNSAEFVDYLRGHLIV